MVKKVSKSWQCLWLFNDQLRAIIMFMVAGLVISCLMANGEAKSQHLSKNSAKFIRSSSARGQLQRISLQQRLRRDTEDAYYDENYDVIPEMTGEMPKTVGEHLSEHAQKIADSFANMWQAVAESVKNCVEAIKEMFAAEGEDMELTPEQEEQLRAAMEARGMALEEQNEVYRRLYENQV